MVGMKHERYELYQYQSLSLDAKIRMSRQRIKQWYEYYGGMCYVARSGGKDSDVLGHLTKEMYPDVPGVFCDTGLEREGVRNHALSVADVVIRPKKDFVSIVTEYGYPVIGKEVAQKVYECQRAVAKGKPMPSYHLDRFNGLKLSPDGSKSPYNMEKWAFLLSAPFRISHRCCSISKKNPSIEYEKRTGRKPMIATLACESRLREQKWERFGCLAFEQERPTAQPLSFWTEQDILLYIKRNNLEIAKEYGEIVYTDSDGFLFENSLFDDEDFFLPLTTSGLKRTGCAFCLFGITGVDQDRFLRLKEAEPKKYDYIMRGGKFLSGPTGKFWVPDKGLGYRFVIDWLNEHGNLGIRY